MKIIKEELTIGSDPEFSLRNKHTGELVSAIGLIKGTKAKPYPMDLKGFAMQVDNVNCEYNIPAVKTVEEFDSALQYGIDYIQRYALPEDVVPCFDASKFFPDTLLDNDIAREFGCTPSINAWREEINPSPSPAGNLRSCGFHIHLGYKTNVEDIMLKFDVVRAMDLFLTVPSMVIDPDTERRKLYGKAGEMRMTNYGFEFRCLSSYFNSSSELRKWCFNQTMLAIDYVNSNPSIESNSELGQKIQNAINNNDTNLVYELIDEFKITLPNTQKEYVGIS